MKHFKGGNRGMSASRVEVLSMGEEATNGPTPNTLPTAVYVMRHATNSYQIDFPAGNG
jgi:hypothetical protein